MKEVAERYGKLLADVDRQWKEAARRARRSSTIPTRRRCARVLYGPDSPADAPLELDWGFLSLFPDRATQAEYEKLLRALENWLREGAAAGDGAARRRRGRTTRASSSAATPAGRATRPAAVRPRSPNPNRKPFGDGSGRLDLAREIVSKDNPLTARVFVNRVWMHHFGRALVGTPGDFGLRGDAADAPGTARLARRRVRGERAGRVKQLHKLIMTSATYTQSSLDRADAHRRSTPRTACSGSRTGGGWSSRRCTTRCSRCRGQLDAKLGGPPVQAVRRQQAPRGLRLRRSPGVPEPVHDVRRAEPGGDCTPERTTTTVAPQALFLMNGPFARDAAKKLRRNAGSARPTDAGRPARRAVPGRATAASRPTDEREAGAGVRREGPEADRWVDLAHGLLMTNEFAFVD